MKQERLTGMLASFKRRKPIKDDFGNEVVMFFNEDFVDDIMPLMSSYRYNKVSRVNKNDKRKAVIRHGIVQIKASMKMLDENYKFNVEDFIRYGQTRGKNWDYMNLLEFNEQKHIIPTPKKKFMNPRKRRRYVISK